ncbi:MAG: hypothetical protein ACLQVD_05065, partial [Capsulimonadaceae bacterium]
MNALRHSVSDWMARHPIHAMLLNKAFILCWVVCGITGALLLAYGGASSRISHLLTTTSASGRTWRGGWVLTAVVLLLAAVYYWTDMNLPAPYVDTVVGCAVLGAIAIVYGAASAALIDAAEYRKHMSPEERVNDIARMSGTA